MSKTSKCHSRFEKKSCEKFEEDLYDDDFEDFDFGDEEENENRIDVG
jgi:hypothetical protein